MPDFPLPPWWPQGSAWFLDQYNHNMRLLAEGYTAFVEQPERIRFDIVTFAILRLSEDMRITYYNPAAQELFGEGVRRGSIFAELLPASATANLMPEITQNLAAGRSFSTDIELPSP